MSGLTQHKSKVTKLHPDVKYNPYYVLQNPTMYTRDEVAVARYNAFHNPEYKKG